MKPKLLRKLYKKHYITNPSEVNRKLHAYIQAKREFDFIKLRFNSERFFLNRVKSAAIEECEKHGITLRVACMRYYDNKVFFSLRAQLGYNVCSKLIPFWMLMQSYYPEGIFLEEVRQLIHILKAKG